MRLHCLSKQTVCRRDCKALECQELMFAERSLNRRNPTHNGRSLQPETDGRSYPHPGRC
jgi:hypothetical protein